VPWWQHQWALAAVALLALLAGAALGYAIGSSEGGSTRTVARETATQALTHTVTHTAAPTTSVVVHTSTVTVTRPSAPPSSAGESGAGEGAAHSGSGTMNVGTLEVPRSSTLRWTCEGQCGRFSIFNSPSDENSISLTSGGHSGSTPISAGTYHEVRVVTKGSWTFRIE
jgi:hypothetical protein